jgi:NAD+ diphosphatase
VRSIAPQVPVGEAGILAQGRSLLDWHARHGFCAVCGSPTEPRDGGYARRCGNAACNAQHFPRTDPVVIMLVLQGDRCLLGRQPMFPPGMFSALAGFVEPGETLEEAVRREVAEEAGIASRAVRYHASQPWPFPSSLMIGCMTEATSEAIEVDRDELEDAAWFAKSEVAEMLRRSLTPETPRMPPPLSLAHQLAKAWVEGRFGGF